MSNKKTDELQKIANENDSEMNLTDSQSETNEAKDSNGDDELSKEEINEELDVQFAKKPGNKSQHLLSPDETETLCGVGLGDDVPISDTPGPFDPICGNCRRSIGDTRVPGMSRDELRAWLSDNIEDVDGPDTMSNPSNFKKKEMEAIVSHIRSDNNE